jgi:hypothetical protein
MSAAPLPHTIAIELSTNHGVTTFDPVFQRHSPLPAETRKTYRAERTLRPSDIESTLPIKFWEIEVSEDPQEKWWAGCVHLRADQIKRPIMEGSELELVIKIDASRKISVELFVPVLNQSFSDDVYVPDPPHSRTQFQQELDLCFERIDHVLRAVYESDRSELAERVLELQQQAENIAEQANREAAARAAGGGEDPDAALRPTDALRKLRIRLSQIEEHLGVCAMETTLSRKLRWQVPYVERMVQTHGTETAKRAFQRIGDQYQRYDEANDARGLKWIHEQIWKLFHVVVEEQIWFWENVLENLKSPSERFVNREEAARAIADGEKAQANRDLPGLRSACRRAWALQPKDLVEAAQEKAAQSGLRSD